MGRKAIGTVTIRFEPQKLIGAMRDLMAWAADLVELLPEWEEAARMELRERMEELVGTLDEAIKEAREKDLAARDETESDVGRAEDYDRRVEFRQRNETPGVIGTQAQWVTYCFRWAAFDEGGSGNESVAAGQTLAVESRPVRIRWDTETKSIDPKMRMIYQGRTFEIISVEDPGLRRVELKLMVREVTA